MDERRLAHARLAGQEKRMAITPLYLEVTVRQGIQTIVSFQQFHEVNTRGSKL
jgi:hypothetical protein